MIKRLQNCMSSEMTSYIRRLGLKKAADQIEQTLDIYNVYDSYKKYELNKTNSVCLTARKLGLSEATVWNAIKKIENEKEFITTESKKPVVLIM